MESVLNWIVHNPWVTLLGAVTIVQIAPIKIDPWTWLAKKIKSVLLGDVEKKVDDLSKEMLEEKINVKRWHILDFANSCRQGRKHTTEEWKHCLEELDWYEKYCETHNVKNGVIRHCKDYLDAAYQRCLSGQDEFLGE